MFFLGLILYSVVYTMPQFFSFFCFPYIIKMMSSTQRSNLRFVKYVIRFSLDYVVTKSRTTITAVIQDAKGILFMYSDTLIVLFLSREVKGAPSPHWQLPINARLFVDLSQYQTCIPISAVIRVMTEFWQQTLPYYANSEDKLIN